MPNRLSKINHVVQLMLENRSFDQMLGFLYADQHNKSPSGQPFDGLTGDESNPEDTGRQVRVYKIAPGADHAYFMPGADPGEGFYNTNLQLFSTQHPAAGDVANNMGFVVNFKSAIASDLARNYKDTLPGTVPSEIMGAYSAEALPIMSTLARGYAVCDRWFASVPTQTIPNRAFAAAGTSQGHLDNHVKTFTCPTIFGRLSARNLDWAIYGYNSVPLTRTDFPDTLNADASHFGHFSDFKKRARDGTLPAYTFLEPSFSATGNSQHPNYDVAAGEQLLHEVYYTIRNGRSWNNTLLIITYDEHGGNFDHVVPPTTATPPDGLVGEFDAFDFKRFGVRVPALLISPLIAAGTVFRAPDGTGTIDHTSVLKTIESRWDLTPLTERDKAAPSLAGVLTLDKGRTDDPLEGIRVPVSSTWHSNQSRPSELETLHALRLSQLPIPDEHGHYKHVMPDLSTSALVHDYIEGRTALWDRHQQRVRAQRDTT
jgi:phospholipase C